MLIRRTRVRAAVIAVLRVLLFTVLFLALQQLFSLMLLKLTRADAFTLDTAATLAAAVTAGALLLRTLEHRPFGHLGFPLTRQAAPQLLLGLTLGVVGLLGACLLMVAFGVLRYRTDSGSLVQWFGGTLHMLLLLLIPAAAEEALFRGYPFQKLVEGFGAIFGMAALSAVFAFAHANNPAINAFAFVNIFAAGIMLSLAYLATRSLWFATGVHLGWNWCMAALLDLPVSGLELFDTPLYEPVDRGPVWMSGGVFGPEAGLAGLLGLMFVLCGVLWMTRKTQWLK